MSGADAPGRPANTNSVLANSGHDLDVLVAGAGSAGVAAACAAAATGARTLLVEASGHVGGTLAWQLLEHSAGFHDQFGNQITAGFAQRLIDLLAEYGGTPGHIRDDVGYTATRTPVNHAELALAEAAMLRRHDVELWLDTRAADAVTHDGVLREVRVHTPAGARAIRSRMVVDCTGDATVAHLAGARSHADVAETQPASLLFKLAAVDFAELLDYLRRHPGEIREGSVVGDVECEHVNFWGLGSLLREGHATGRLSLSRHEMHVAGWPRRGEAVVNVTRGSVVGAPDDRAGGDLHGMLAVQVLEFARWFRQCVPGCRNAYVAAVADRTGVRESRRIIGEYTLTGDDVRSGARFRDAVARAGFPIDVHAADRPSLSHTEQLAVTYDIPYGCLVAAGLTNVLVAGRCLSSTHDANGSARITATCFATGEAAGVAAALAASNGVAAREVDVARVRHILASRGAVLR